MVKCEVEGCTIKKANFNFPGEAKGRRCGKHKLENMINLSTRKCNFSEEGKPCLERAVYGIPGKSPEKCSTHKHPEMINLTHAKCDFKKDGIKCYKVRIYGFIGEKATKCGDHREDGMINVTAKKCEYVHPESKKKCLTMPIYGFETEKVSRCFEHKLPGMIDIKNQSKICTFSDPITHKNCIIRASYGIQGEKATRCKTHKLDNMINVVNKRCEMCETIATFGFRKGEGKGEGKGEKEGIRRCKSHIVDGMADLCHDTCLGTDENEDSCTSRPNYGFPGGKAEYCSKHKLEGMKDIVSKRCSYASCDVRPSFNFEGLKPEFCLKHKSSNMVRVTGSICEVEGCKIRARYNYETETGPKRCTAHILDGMINFCEDQCDECEKRAYYAASLQDDPIKCKNHKLKNMVKVLHKERPKCEKCHLGASYGSLFQKKNHCFGHKLSNEFKINNPICVMEGCKEKAYFTDDGSSYPRRCETHALNNDVNIVESPCKMCGLTYLLNEKTGLCDTCNDVEVKKIHKVKENETLHYLQSNGVIFTIKDSIPEYACNTYRPDAVIDLTYFILILEIDEFQHKSYQEDCEKIRMMSLHQDYGGIPVVFIRYNPDSYKIRLEDGTKKIINPSNSRLSDLLGLIRRFQYLKEVYETNPLPPLSVCYMFYNGYTGAPNVQKIDVLEEIKEKDKHVLRPKLKILK